MLTRIQRALRMFVEGLIRNISGRLGWWLRYQYYSRVFQSCGKNVRIDENVFFYGPENISVGTDVWIGPFTILTARSAHDSDPETTRALKKRNNSSFKGTVGQIFIGNSVSIGAYNMIQGYGGIVISDCFTSSARVSIYSFSHHPCDERHPEKITYANSMVKEGDVAVIQSPIMIERNVWLGLNVIVFGGTLGQNTFVATGAIVIGDIPENSFAAGNPAVRIKPRFAGNPNHAEENQAFDLRPAPHIVPGSNILGIGEPN